MYGMATRTATLPLRRRLIGSFVVLAGALIVLAGSYTDLSGSSIDPSKVGPTTGQQPGLGNAVGTIGAGLTTSGDTLATGLRHIIDHGVSRASTVSTIADVSQRAGLGLVAVGAILAVLLLLTPMRGFIGPAAGLGLFGVALLAGDIAGSNTQISDALGGAVHITVGRGVVILGIGFVVILAGGAVAAVRPLAGLFSGVGLAVVGVVAGLGLALLVGGDKLVGGSVVPPGVPLSSPTPVAVAPAAGAVAATAASRGAIIRA